MFIIHHKQHKTQIYISTRGGVFSSFQHSVTFLVSSHYKITGAKQAKNMPRPAMAPRLLFPWLSLCMLVEHAAAQCALGQYLIDPSVPTCAACGNGGSSYACALGEFMDGAPCDGTLDVDTQTCATCGNGGGAYDCGLGFHMTGIPCGGLDMEDTQTCAPCGNGGAAYTCGSGTETGTACDGMGMEDTQTCSSDAGGGGDPHLTFANGGRADFRGSHRACYVFVSSPGFQFAPYFQAIDFELTSSTGVRQLVHGTFMTRAYWRVRTSSGRHLLIWADAMRRGEVDVLVLQQGAPAGSRRLGPWQTASWDEVHVSTRMLTAIVATRAWQVNVTSKPIYGLQLPVLNASHYHGKWEVEQRRFDVAIRGAFPQPSAHGVIGQSYRDTVVRHGRLDEYGAAATPELIDSDGNGPDMTTAAQAEGAIDGVYTDYRLPAPFSVEFPYSRFDASEPDAPVRPDARQHMVTSRASDVDAGAPKGKAAPAPAVVPPTAATRQ